MMKKSIIYFITLLSFSYVTTKEVLLRTGKPFETLKKFNNPEPTYEQEIQDFINERDQLLNERDQLLRSIYQYQRNIGQITQDEIIFNVLYQQARSLNKYKASLNKHDEKLTIFSSLLNIPINLTSSNETNELLNDIKNLRVKHNTLQVKIDNSLNGTCNCLINENNISLNEKITQRNQNINLIIETELLLNNLKLSYKKCQILLIKLDQIKEIQNESLSVTLTKTTWPKWFMTVIVMPFIVSSLIGAKVIPYLLHLYTR